MPRSARTSLLAALALLAAPLPVAAGEALSLSDDASVQRFAETVERWGGASRVRWEIRAASAGEARRILGAVATRLGPAGADLMERVGAAGQQASARALSGPGDTPVATAVMTIGAEPPARCSWRLTLTDPAAPSGSRAAAEIPLEDGDRVPASDDATFEIAAAGPLQSTYYAFGETTPGTVRDLAAAPAFDIAVAAETEQILLVRTRRPVPFLDGIRERLAARPGAPADLGRDAALTERFRNQGRGIGANIQLVDPSMILPGGDTALSAGAPETGTGATAGGDRVARLGDLAETCHYTILR